MADTDRYESVHKMTENHQDAEGTSIRESLHVKVRDFSDLSFVERQKIIFNQFMTPKLIALFWVWFAIQFVVAPFIGIELGSEQWRNLFLLSGDNFYSIALFTNIIGHGGLFHIAINSLVFYSFGLQAEQVLEDYEYLLFFLVAGLLASIAQILLPTFLSLGATPAIIGASGAISGVMGVVAVKNPNETVYLLFAIPMKLWKGIALFIVGSTAAVLIWGSGAGGFGHIAHITGAVFGVIVGLILPRSMGSAINIKPPEFN